MEAEPSTKAASTRSAASRRGEDIVPDEDCNVEVPDDGREMNVGLRMKHGSDGICDEDDPDSPCYVALDKSERYGWRESKRASGVRSLELPSAVCEGSYETASSTPCA